MDFVKPLKLEGTGDGSDFDLFPSQADETEDILWGKGVAVESKDMTIEKSGNDMVFKDLNQTTPLSLTDIYNIRPEDEDNLCAFSMMMGVL